MIKKLLFIAILVAALVFCPVNADAFSAWSAYGGDAWRATNDTYTLLKWNATGNHTWTVPAACTGFKYLIVAGGGGGGSNRGGGGGGGGILNGTISGPNATYFIMVGSGGTGGTYNNNNAGQGGNSSINSSYVAIGGGRGGGAANSAGGNGGSGGGGTAATQAGGTGTSGQGKNGGQGAANVDQAGAGGGGGAGVAGSNGLTTGGGAGGNGLQFDITGTSTYYAGGGGGGFWNTGNQAAGGLGGGGYSCNGSTSSSGYPGTDGLGGGGGGANTGSSTVGGKGGSGVVIVLYISPPEIPVANFTAAPIAGFAPLTVYFQDNSTEDPTYWNWSFGDGNYSTAQSTQHTYNGTGQFIVTLTAGNTAGNSSTSRTISVWVPAVGHVDDYQILGIPDTATSVTIDPKYQSFDVPSGKAIYATDLKIPLGTTGTFTITQANGDTVDGSFSYTGWPRATFTCTVGDSSSTEEYSWPNQLLAPPMYLHFGMGTNTTSKTRAISAGYGQVKGYWNHVVSEEVIASPVTRFTFDADNDIVATAIYNDFGMTLQSWLTGMANQVTDPINSTIELVKSMESYARLMWGVFLSLLYWLKFLFVDNLILTATMYILGTLAYDMLTSRNVYQALGKWFRQQKALFEFFHLKIIL